MAANESYTCIHEDQIQGQSRKIERLEARADFKDRRLDELNEKIDKMDGKLDTIADTVNDFILQSSQQDNQLEIRLTKIETDMENQKLEAQRRTVWIGIGLTIITILINTWFHMIA
ncbi:hypothetical protein [Methanobrevibacter sp.]|uniref:hypothetical protein n=1 Tax=Methanobrevibacter sp. TaxID=66852 RepID=UPI00386E406D